MDKTSASFWKLPKEVLAGIAIIGCFMAYVIYDQSHWWEAKPDYSFGYLVPLFVAFVLYDRWPKMAAYFFPSENPPYEAPSFVNKVGWLWTAGFTCVFLGGLAFFALGGILRANAGVSNVSSLVVAMGFGALFISLVYFLADKTAAGEKMSAAQRLALVSLFVFPSLVWLISAPLISAIENRLSLFLMNKVSWVVFELFNLLGIALRQEGNKLLFPNGEQVLVAEACSGIRSLTGCLFSGAFLSATFLNKWWKKILLIACAMGLAVFTNLIRSAALTGFAYNYGTEVLDKEMWGSNVHDLTGYAVLILTTLGLLVLLPFFDLKEFLARRYIPADER